MNLRHQIFAVVGSVMLLFGTGVTGLAQSAPNATGNASVTVTSDTASNFLAVGITNASFGGVPYSFQNQSTTGSLTVGVVDTRGSTAGWKVTLSASDFSTSDGALVFDISNLALIAGTQAGLPYSTGDPIPSTANMVGTSAAPVQETGVGSTKIWSAAVLAGAGRFNLPLAGTLIVPGGTLVGSYTSVVTVSIQSGP